MSHRPTVVALTLIPILCWAGLRDIVPRPQEMGRLSEFPMSVPGTLYLVVPDTRLPAHEAAEAELARLMEERFSRSPILVPWSQYAGQSPAIWFGTPAEFPDLAEALTASGLPGMTVPERAEAYRILVDEDRILLCGSDKLGLRWSVLSLMYLMGEVNGTLSVDRVFVSDWPDFPVRVATVNHPIRNDEQELFCHTIADTAYYYKFGEIEWNNSDAGLPNLSQSHIDRIVELRSKIADRGQRISMSVDRLGTHIDQFRWQEAVPVQGTRMRAVSSGFSPVTDGYGVEIDNPGFDTWSGGYPVNWTVSHPYMWGHFSRDTAVRHGGSSSLRISGFTEPTGDPIWQVIDVEPYSWVTLSLWYKTSGYSGTVHLRGQGTDEPAPNDVIMTRLPVESTANWTELRFNFCTFHLDEIRLMISPGYATAGTIWIDDVSIQTADFEHIVRRPDCHFRVYLEPQMTLMTENVDYRLVETHTITYDQYIRIPRLERLPGSRIPLYGYITVDWSCAVPFQGGRRTPCFSLLEPLQEYQSRIRRVDSLLNPEGYNIHINEVAYAGHDELCQSRNLSPAQLVGGYCRHMYDIIQAQSPGAVVRTYGDAFDIHVHDKRAHPVDYTPWTAGVNGEGSLQQLPPDVQIMAMTDYTSDLDSSFISFGQNGFSALTAIYIEDDLRRAARYMGIGRRYPNCIGIQAYGWDLSVYDELPVFASLGWNMGPHIIHSPPILNSTIDSLTIASEIWTDPLAETTPATIRSVTLRYRWLPSGTWIERGMWQTATDHYQVTLPPGGEQMNGLEYQIRVEDSRDLIRSAPAGDTDTYVISLNTTSPQDLERTYLEIEYSTDEIGDRTLIEWTPVQDAVCYELHYGATPRFGKNSETLLAIQNPYSPRYLLDPDPTRRFVPERLRVFAVRDLDEPDTRDHSEHTSRK